MESQEPVAVKPYPGNMLDLIAVQDFIADFPVSSGLLVMDKGFSSEANISKLKEIDGLSFIIPLKQSARKVRDNGLLEPFASVLDGYQEATILYKKVKVNDSCFLYAFRDPRCAYEQRSVGTCGNRENLIMREEPVIPVIASEISLRDVGFPAVGTVDTVVGAYPQPFVAVDDK